MKIHHLMSVGVSRCSYGEFLDTVLTFPATRKSSYVCFANVHMITECHRDHSYRKIINGADLVAPDGKPVAVLLGLASGKRQQKISGPDLFEDLLRRCAESNRSVYFYGSTSDILYKLELQLRQRFPDLQIKGCYSPPFRELTEDEMTYVVEMVNDAAADFIFVALGCPRQEKWMAANQGKIKGCMLGVGQAFQVHAGTLKRAPLWMQDAGLEWAFRLYMDPLRLWKRYIYTNAYFLYLLLRYRLSSGSGEGELTA